MMKAHNATPMEMSYRILCIVLKTEPITLDTVERGLAIGYVVVNNEIDNMFWEGFAVIRLDELASRKVLLLAVP